MLLEDYLREEYIIADLKARDKNAILDEMASDASAKVAGVSRDRLLDALLERERLGTTGIGHGVAIPHGKLKGLDEIRIFFGRSKRGVDFKSMDKLPVFLFFMIVAPENSAVTHLKILASISHLLKNQDFRVRLMKAADRAEIYRIIIEADKKAGML